MSEEPKDQFNYHLDPESVRRLLTRMYPGIQIPPQSDSIDTFPELRRLENPELHPTIADLSSSLVSFSSWKSDEEHQSKHEDDKSIDTEEPAPQSQDIILVGQENPQNWPPLKKWTTMGLLSFITLLTPLASSMFAPGVPLVNADFHNTNDSLSTLVVSVYLLGYAAGPLVVAPLSEIYGRLWIYHVCNVLYLLCTVACALAPSMGFLIGFRFLAGGFGSTPLSNAAGSIADIMTAEQRGHAMAIWQLGPLLGPVIGPICGGFIAQHVGWRWIFWVLSIACGVSTLACLLVFRETYRPVLLARKMKRIHQQKLNAGEQVAPVVPIANPRAAFARAMIRPLKLLFLSPTCGLMSLWTAVAYALLYLLFSTYSFVFSDQYHFDASTVGLVYLGLGIGLCIGFVAIATTWNRISLRLANKYNNGQRKPEYRLPMAILLGPTIPIGMIIYGWTAQYQTHWAIPLLGTLFIGIGMVVVFMSISSYLIEAFTRYAASAAAANVILRSLLAAVFPLFALQMYDAMGLGWGNTLLAFIALALCPVPWLFFMYGERLRTHPRFQVKLD